MALLSILTQHASLNKKEQLYDIRLGKQTDEQMPFVDEEQTDQSSQQKEQSMTGAEPLKNAVILILSLLCIYLAVRPLWDAVPSIPRPAGVSIVRGVVQVGTHIETFALDAAYTGWPSDTIDQKWEGLMPQGRGFVSLDTIKQAQVPGSDSFGRDVDPASSYCVAAFHQLHCLYWLRNGFYSAVRNKTIHLGHMDHCFDYLRQTILCQADGTLELASVELHGVNGAGPRQCKNYDTLFAWAEQVRNNDRLGII